MIQTEQNKAEKYLLGFFINKKWRFVRHVGMILVTAVSMFPPEELTVAFLQNAGEENPVEVLRSIRLTFFLLFIESLVGVYLNLYLLIPWLLFRNKFILYFLACVAIVTVNILLEFSIPDTIQKYLPPEFVAREGSLKSILGSSVLGFVFLVATAGYKIFKKWVYESKQLAAIKEAKLKEELSNLKNQINPHFLFNTLNNLNTLITTNPNKASAVALGLSDVLRFYLYEADKDNVLLKKDIDTLKQVLELEKIRRTDFQFALTTNSDIKGIIVPPFIFINFVENAIKHSLSDNSFSYLNICFSVDGSYLVFECENSIPKNRRINEYGGLGLKNVQRRLELIYGQTYTLVINEGNDKFTVELKLPL